VIDQNEIEVQIKNIDERTARIEQILPTLATKDDLKAFATKDDLKAFATRDDLKAFATKDDLKGFATMESVREEGERTRRHFDVVAEKLKQDIALVVEGQQAEATSVNTRFREVDATLESHDKRLMKLEGESMKRRR
jgi:hypothetical protein